MTTAEKYAKALFELAQAQPSNMSLYLRNMSTALERRGQSRLIRQVLSAYERLELRANRQARIKRVSAEREQTRILLELYQKLIHG